VASAVLRAAADRPREGETVVVWKIDRLSRSPRDGLPIMARIADAGVGVGRPRDIGQPIASRGMAQNRGGQ